MCHYFGRNLLAAARRKPDTACNRAAAYMNVCKI